MITTIIVVASLALAAAFTLAWLLKPSLREQIEAPKHLFHDQVRQYDRDIETARSVSGGSSDESE
ncbi:MAG: hypothetical protein GWN29_13095 [Gammaproteobacteria bacterium]|nr:hypothetical protein [Gammaproteobacteria bacterium]